MSDNQFDYDKVSFCDHFTDKFRPLMANQRFNYCEEVLIWTVKYTTFTKR